MAIQRDLLRELAMILKASCHTKGCATVSKCPKQCRCRSKRPFKLNTETSICWEIADQIFDLVKISRPSKTDINHLTISTYAYSNLGRFHMTNGWQTFFLDISRTVQSLCENPTYWSKDDEMFISLQKRTRRLKREPNWSAE